MLASANAVEQIVGRERRERLSQLAWCGEGCFESRRRVNSTVRHLSLMTQITYRDWILDCDVEVTRAGYETISAGGAESCDCAGCRNFLAQRESVYPAEILNLFDELGVNSDVRRPHSHLPRAYLRLPITNQEPTYNTTPT